MISEDSTNIENYLPGNNTELLYNNNELKMPDVIGILPIRNVVVYPGTVMPLAIGRERSKALLAETKPNESIVGIVTQRNPQTDKPAFDDLYSIGTAASVLKVIKMPQGSMELFDSK
jgi:ATP-dependent Lon protease